MSQMTASFEAAEEDQKRVLQEALGIVKRQAYFMKQAIDENNLEETIRTSTLVLRELRTGALSPPNYYELWIAVTDELRHLREYFVSLNRQGKPMVDLYQRVQYASIIVPRLYLLMTVGGVFIASQEAPSRDILKDLVEMSKGVQHPVRGLFLRNYLSQVTKDCLPDRGSKYEESGGGDVNDAISFILENFAEMNRLWVRMQHIGKAKDRPKREQQRQQLKLLVGTNLVRLSQLEGVDVDMYTRVVLPKLLEQVTNCNDALAQQYLMDCLIQVFPDDYHLATLREFLETCAVLQPQVDVASIIKALMKRISDYAKANGGPAAIPPETRAFEIVDEHVSKVLVAYQASMQVSDMLSLQVGLLDFALHCFSVGKHVASIDRILGQCVHLLSARWDNGRVAAGKEVRHIVQLLTTPLKVLSIQVLSISHYPQLMGFLDWDASRRVASKLLAAVLSSDATTVVIQEASTLTQLLKFIRPLLEDATDEKGEIIKESKETNMELEDTQNSVARLIHRISIKDRAQLFQMIKVAREMLSKGGQRRIGFTLTPLCFKCLQLTRLLVQDDMARATAAETAELTSATAAVELTSSSAAEAVAVDDVPTETADEKVKKEKEDVKSEGDDDDDVILETVNALVDAAVSDAEGANGDVSAAADDDDLPVADVVDAPEVPAVAKAAEEEEQKTEPSPSAPAIVVIPDWGINPSEVFQLVHEMLTRLSSVQGRENIALRLFLQSALAADYAGEEQVAYEFVVQALTLYEDTADTKTQLHMMKIIIGTMQSFTVFGKENYETLTTKTAQYAARLLKQPDKCRMVYSCAHLFWATEPIRPLREGEQEPAAGRDGAHALECLKKALKIADATASTGPQLDLFLEILNRYLFFFDSGLEVVEAKFLSGLVAIVKDHVAHLGDQKGTKDGNNDAAMASRLFYQATMDCLRRKQVGAQAERYSAVVL